MGFVTIGGELFHTSQLPAGGKITISPREAIMSRNSQLGFSAPHWSGGTKTHQIRVTDLSISAGEREVGCLFREDHESQWHSDAALSKYLGFGFSSSKPISVDHWRNVAEELRHEIAVRKKAANHPETLEYLVPPDKRDGKVASDVAGPGLSAFGWASLWDRGRHWDGGSVRAFDTYTEEEQKRWIVFSENANAMLADGEKRVAHLQERVYNLEDQVNELEAERQQHQAEVLRLSKTQKENPGPDIEISEPSAPDFPRYMQVKSCKTGRLLGKLWQCYADSLWVADPPLEYELMAEGWKSESRDWEEARIELYGWYGMPSVIAESDKLPPVEPNVVDDAMTQLRKVLHERRQAGIPDGTPPKEWSDHAQTIGWAYGLLPRVTHEDYGSIRQNLIQLLIAAGVKMDS